MPSVNDWIKDAMSEAPPTFEEKEKAIAFLNETNDVTKRYNLALDLLSNISASVGFGEAWKCLVQEWLQKVEKSFRQLLPQHRDHVIHSAHLYLLGVAIYLRMIRGDVVLKTILASTYVRDIMAMFTNNGRPYPCQPSIFDRDCTLEDARETLNGVDNFYAAIVRMEDCDAEDGINLCSIREHAEKVLRHACCEQRRSIKTALDAMYEHLNTVGMFPMDISPVTDEDIDLVFKRKWSMAALMHDNAYPLELATLQIETYFEGVVADYSCTLSPCDKPFGFHFSRCCDFLTMPLLQPICAKQLNSDMVNNDALHIVAANLANRMGIEYSPSVLSRMMSKWVEDGLAKGQVDHGVFSSVLFLKHMNYHLREKLDSMDVDKSKLIDDDEKRFVRKGIGGDVLVSTVQFFYTECADAAAAIYLHNAKKYITLFKELYLDYRDHPIAWLLYLCDQLQEWMRPSGDWAADDGKMMADMERYKFTITGDPQIIFEFPDASKRIRDDLKAHLRVFGEDVVRFTQ